MRHRRRDRRAEIGLLASARQATNHVVNVRREIARAERASRGAETVRKATAHGVNVQRGIVRKAIVLLVSFVRVDRAGDR